MRPPQPRRDPPKYGEQILLEKARAQGRSFLLAFADLDTARRNDPGGCFAGIQRHALFRMVLADPEVDGILVPAVSANDAWAAASRESIARLLAESESATR